MNDKIVLATIFSFLASLFWIIIVYKIDKHEKEPIPLLLKLFFTSMLLSIVAGFLNTLNTKLFGEFGTLIFVGLVEEGVKLLAVWIIVFKHKEFNTPIDGVIYASVSALGFAFMENIEYNYLFFKTVDSQHIDYAITLRAFIPFMHVLISSIWGYALGMYKLYIFKKQQVILLFLLSAIVHSVYDITVTIAPVVMTLAFAILISIFIFRVSHLNRISNQKVKFFIACPNCNHKIAENSLFCRYCGTKIVLKPFSTVKLYCRYCYYLVKENWEFCKNCGKKI